MKHIDDFPNVVDFSNLPSAFFFSKSVCSADACHINIAYTLIPHPHQSFPSIFHTVQICSQRMAVLQTQHTQAKML